MCSNSAIYFIYRRGFQKKSNSNGARKCTFESRSCFIKSCKYTAKKKGIFLITLA